MVVGGYRPKSDPSKCPFASKTSKIPEIQPCRGVGKTADRSEGCRPHLRFIRALTGYYHQLGWFLKARDSFLVDFRDFSLKKPGRELLKPGREALEPGRDAPVAHTAPLIGPACMLVPGDGLRRVQNIRDSVRTFIWLQNCDFQVKIRYFKFQNRGVSSPNRGATPRLPLQELWLVLCAC